MNSDEEVAKAAVLEEFLRVDLVGPEFKWLGEQHIAEYKAEHVEERWNGNYSGFAFTAAMDLVVLTVGDECFPVLRPRESAILPRSALAGVSRACMERCTCRCTG
jgi:hypothetical protein